MDHPPIQPCFCGFVDTLFMEYPARGGAQVVCRRCWRRGPLANSVEMAATLWNNDRGDWQAIESAPQDGTPFLVGHVDHDWIDRAFFMDGQMLIVGGNWQPTHWRPMPPGPVR